MNATIGIFFLGTPFRGTDRMFHEQLPEIAKVEFQSTVHSFILQYLTEDNTEVEQLRRNFLELREDCRNEAMKREAMKLICVAEEKPTEIQKIVKQKEEMKVSITFIKWKNHGADK
jgi:hypothetical protein